MNKEQTPIDFLKEKGMLRGSTTKFVINGSFGVVLLNDLLEQYAKSKVLEALEKEFTELGLMAEFYYHDDGLHYYETAVKPKYEKERKQRSN